MLTNAFFKILFDLKIHDFAVFRENPDFVHFLKIGAATPTLDEPKIRPNAPEQLYKR